MCVYFIHSKSKCFVTNYKEISHHRNKKSSSVFDGFSARSVCSLTNLNILKVKGHLKNKNLKAKVSSSGGDLEGAAIICSAIIKFGIIMAEATDVSTEERIKTNKKKKKVFFMSRACAIFSKRYNSTNSM